MAGLGATWSEADQEHCLGGPLERVADALEAQGYVVDRKHIEIDEHIKKLGMFTVGIRLHPEVTGKIRLLIERE